MEIKICAVKASKKLFNSLESKGLIKIIKPSEKALTSKTKTGVVDTFYTSKPEYGAHKFMCIGKRSKEIKFSYHNDNEDVLLIKPFNFDYSPLYLIFALDKVKIFLKKVSLGALLSTDFIAVELEYNNPDTSFFTVLKGSVHSEITVKSDKQHPVFFVTEPSKMKDNKIKINNINFRIE